MPDGFVAGSFPGRFSAYGPMRLAVEEEPDKASRACAAWPGTGTFSPRCGKPLSLVFSEPALRGTTLPEETMPG